MQSVNVDGTQMAAFDLEGLNELQAFADDAKVNAVKAQQIVYLHNLTVQRDNDRMEFQEREEVRRDGQENKNLIEKVLWQICAMIALM